MVDSFRPSKSLRLFIGLAAFGVVLWALRPYVWLFNSVSLALLIVLCVAPLFGWLKHTGAADWLAMVGTFAGLAIVAVGLGLFLLFTVARLASVLPAYISQLDPARESLAEGLRSLSADQGVVRAVLQVLDAKRLLGPLSEALSGLGRIFVTAFVTLMAVVYLLVAFVRSPGKADRLAQLCGAGWARAVGYGKSMRRYVLITALIGTMTGTANAVLLLILGVDFPVLWGMVTFVLSFVPIIGFWLALVPPFLLALAKFGLLRALLVYLGYILINGVSDNVVKPALMGKGLNITPVAIFLSVFFWAAVLGPVGAILAVPLTVAIKELLLEPDERTEWLAALLSAHGGDADEDAPPA